MLCSGNGKDVFGSNFLSTFLCLFRFLSELSEIIPFLVLPGENVWAVAYYKETRIWHITLLNHLKLDWLFLCWQTGVSLRSVWMWRMATRAVILVDAVTITDVMQRKRANKNQSARTAWWSFGATFTRDVPTSAFIKSSDPAPRALHVRSKKREMSLG